MKEDEWFDVVDAQDRVIGRGRREDVHRRRLFHRSVHILVLNRSGKIFLQKRAMDKDTHPGRWDSSCAGHLDVGESYNDAAEREFEEELGVPPGPLEQLFKIPACAETGFEFSWIYRCYHEGPFVLNKSELQTGRWITREDLEREIDDNPGHFTPAFITLWRRFRDVPLS